jgi:hypothetical protein
MGARQSVPTLRLEDAPDVLLDQHLAAIIGCSARQICRVMTEAPGNLPPTLPSVDHRRRWAKATVAQWLAADGSISRMRQMKVA